MNQTGFAPFIVQDVINKASLLSEGFYCNNQSVSCFGTSLKDGIINNGEGWIKIDLSKLTEATIMQLPKDPFNSQSVHYVYCGTKDGWEINAVLESEKYKDRMESDGGDDPNMYEIGSNLKLIDKIPECKY